MNTYYDLNTFNALFVSSPILMYSFVVWSMVWKGLALWKASQRREKIWFIVLLILNTFGLLEILYLFIFSKYERITKLFKREKEKEEVKEQTNKENSTQNEL